MTAAEALRDWEVDGVPSSGEHKVKKSDLRNVIGNLERRTAAGEIGGAVWKATKALLVADLAHSAGTAAVVYGDATSANNGMYVKAGSSGSGSWSQITTFLPGYQFVTATDDGDSTANAYSMDTNPRLPFGDGVALVEFVVPATNTSGTVMVSFDGDPALTIKTASGNAPAIGGLIGGMPVSGVKIGTSFYMRSDQASAALLAQVELVVDEAEGFKNQAAAYADFARNNWAMAASGLGTGVEADIPLLVDPGSVNNMFVVVGGVGQLVTQGAYSLVYSGGNAFIRMAVPVDVPYEVRVSNAIPVGTPSDGSVSTAKIADGAVATAKLANEAVTFAKTQDIATERLLGRVTAGGGSIEELTADQVKTLLGVSSGKLLDRAYAEYTTNAALTAAIPLDDTIPQSSEGTEILSVSITPKSTTNRLRARACLVGAVSSANKAIIAAIFSGASANALCARYVTAPTADFEHELNMEVEWVPGVTTNQTITVRAGSSSGGNLSLNGNSGGRIFGGASRCTLIVEELEA
ncbi:hypothetical protein [Rhizobium wuzhouense]|nr:hypothetical protein [Rhizobium wuzhouense]